ncbi:MAG TPA: HD domain-containing protein [Phototrophicaceae bacterium]|nr:HD domain-containing protein [Phototrophicaceae bacterium]
MNFKFVGEITDPIHKNIKFTQIEKELKDTPIFQRLRRIRQLAGAHLVYPGALHSRFEHSLGSMFLAGLSGQTLYSKDYLTDMDIIQKLRIAALLHDVGHGPFSHLFEEVSKNGVKFSHESFGQKIITNTIISDIIEKNGYDSKEIASISFGKHKMNFLNEIISGGLSVDLMDYLPRDSYFSGTEYGKIDYHRIINSLEVSSQNNLGINKSSLYSYESMLISRYQMFKAVYFHKSVRSGEVMLVHSMKKQNNALNLTPPNSLEEFFVLHDEMVLEKLSGLSNQRQGNGDVNNVGIKLAKDYQNRNLLKCVYEFFLLSSQRGKNKEPSSASEPDIEKSSIVGIELFDDQVKKLTEIVEEYQKSDHPIFLDVSRAPSIPLAPKKREVTSIMIIDKKSEYEKSFDQIPLINAISGYLDMIRIYTTRDNRQFFENVFDSHFN